MEVFFNFLCSFSDSEECLGPVKHLWWCFWLIRLQVIDANHFRKKLYYRCLTEP